MGEGSMDTIRTLADLSIRRGCAFAALAIVLTMMSLSFDPALAFRAGGAMAALLCLGLALAGWWAPQRDMRRTELWMLLRGAAGDPFRGAPRGEVQALLAAVLRERLLWHAERVGLAALALGFLALLVRAGG